MYTYIYIYIYICGKRWTTSPGRSPPISIYPPRHPLPAAPRHGTRHEQPPMSPRPAPGASGRQAEGAGRPPGQLGGGLARPTPPRTPLGGGIGGPLDYGRVGLRTDHPIQNRSPLSNFRTPERLRAMGGPTRGRRVYEEGGLTGQPADGPPPTFHARQAASPTPCGAQDPSAGLRFRVAGGRTPQSGSPPGPRRCGARSPGALPPPAPVESVDRWPLCHRDHPVSRGEPPRGSRRSPACPRGPDPPPEARMPQPSQRPRRRPGGSPACGPVPGELSVGAIGWPSVSPRCAGGAAAVGRSKAAPLPEGISCHLLPLRGRPGRAVVAGLPARQAPPAPRTTEVSG